MTRRIIKEDLERAVRRLNDLHNTISGQPTTRQEYDIDYAYGGVRVRDHDGTGTSLTTGGRLTKRVAYQQVVTAIVAMETALYAKREMEG